MPLFGTIVVIKRNGTDGISFPLTASSCLFGRRIECDIRIQLPLVSKEHCKIEVNENKEAILTNLSTANPTKLNGSCFQQAVPLKHGDVLTIIDRSFRFEYPLQSTLRKRRSRSPKDEALQVLHVQQVAEVELSPKQPSGSKSLDASDNAECEEKNNNENKQSKEENISKALPVQQQTPKSLHGIHVSIKKQNEMSPFSKLYEKLKREIEVKKKLQLGNASQQAAKDDKSVLPGPSAQISSSCAYDLGSSTKEKEIHRSENIEECKNKIKQDVICLDCNLISAAGSATKKSFTRSPRSLVSKEMSRDGDKRSHLQDREQQSTADVSKGAEVTAKASKENGGNAVFALEQCSIEHLDFAGKMKSRSPAIAGAKPAQTITKTKVSEVDGLSTPASRRKSPRSHFILPAEESGGMNPGGTHTPTSHPGVSLKRKSLSEVLAEARREGSVSTNDGLEQLPLAENKGLKQRRSSKQHTPEKPVKVLLEEIYDQANFNSNDRCSQIPASFSNSESPRRSKKQSKELLNKSVHSETPVSEEFTSQVASPAAQKSGSGKKRGRPRTSGLLTEKASEANAIQEHHEKTADRKESGTKELPMKGCHQKQDLEDASVTRPHRLSSQRRSENATALKDSEAPASELNLSDLLAGGGSGKTKRISQKRRSGDLLPQPLGKRKRVSFGGQLSPELFDKSLPPNSPLKRGATPARLSLMFGNSPRAVLKKAQGLKHSTAQELSKHLQKEKMSPKHLQAQKSPVASSPTSGKTTPHRLTSGSPAPYRKGRFSVSHLMTSLPTAEEKDADAEDTSAKEESGGQVKTPKSSPPKHDDKPFVTATSDPQRRSSQLALKVTPMKRRSGAVAVLNAKRSSGASSANLLAAKSWAEVVKSGVARPQPRTVKKSARKGRSLKKRTQSPKTPERKTKGHFSTGHAESPATIVVGRAYSTTVRTAGQAPKVVKNPLLKLNMNTDESFTAMMEKFQTPENRKMLPLATIQKTDFTPACAAEEISELHTPEETGEMMVSPLNSSAASEQKQDSPGICLLLREEESPKSTFVPVSSKTAEKRNAMLEENTSVDTFSRIPEKQTSWVKSGSKRRTPKQKSEPVEVLSGIKDLFRTPKQKSEPVEVLSGIKELMKTPKQKSEPVEVLSGIKQLMKTPKRKSEPVEVLSGIKELMKTPKQKSEPVEVLSGIKELMKTPKQKSEPVEVLSGIKELMKTPKQKSEPVEVLSGIKQLMKTPKQKSEPVEVLSGIKELMKTPKQKSEPVEVLSGIKQLMKTPKQKSEPVEVLSGIKQLIKTPKQKSEPVEVLSGIKQLMKTPKQKSEPVEVLSGIKQLMKTPKQKSEPVEVLSGIKQLMKTPKQKSEPVEVLSGIKQLMKTPKQKSEPVEVLSGIKQLVKTPKQKSESVEVLSGIKELFRTPKQKSEPLEVLSGIKQLMKTPKQKSEPVEVLSGIKQLMKTPKQKSEPVEVLSGIKELFRTPQENSEPFEVLSGIKELLRTPQQELEPVTDEVAFRRSLNTPVEKMEAAEDVASVNLIKKPPKLKCQPVEDMIGVSHIFKTPKEKFEPIEDMFGISRLVKTPREKCQPVEDFVGLQKLMAEPRQKGSDFEVDYVGVMEMFDRPEEMKVRSANVMDSKQEDNAPPSTNSSHMYEDKGNISQGEESQQKEATSEDQSTKRPRRGRPQKTVHCASAKQCEEDLNLQELQGLEKKSTQEEIGEISSSTSVTINKGKGRRRNHCVGEEIVSKLSDQEKMEAVPFVQPQGASRRRGRGKSTVSKVLKHPSENQKSCGKDSSVLQKELANMKQTLQEYGINEILETVDEPNLKAISVSSSNQNENHHPRAGLKEHENKSSKDVEGSEEMLLSPGKSTRGVKKVENTESLIPPKRGRRARNVQVKQPSSEGLHRTRRLRKDPSAKVIKRDEQTFEKDTETAPAEESENGTKLNITEERVKPSRSARKHSPEVKANVCGTALENTQNILKTEETLTETQSHIKNEIKVSQGDDTENAQENTAKASQRLKAESPSGETSKMPVTALNLEANRSALQETKITRSRRGRKDSLEKKTDQVAKVVNNVELITPQIKSETEMDESSLTYSLGSVCVKGTDQVTKDQSSPAATAAPAPNSDSLALGRRKRTRNELKAKQAEILQENEAQKNGTACRRGTGKKVRFLDEASSKVVEGKRSLPEDNKGTTCEDSQCETAENPPSQVRKSRRKQVDSIPQIACSASVEKQTLIADQSKEEAFVKEQGVALEAAASSTEDNPPRRGRRREVTAASQTSRSLSVRRRCGLLEGDDKTTAREDQNPALVNKTLLAKASKSARDQGKKTDLAAEAKRSSSLQRKCDLADTGEEEEGTNEEQNVPLETVSCAKEKLLGRGRRRVTALASHTTHYISLRGKHGLPANRGEREVSKDDQNVPLETSDSSVKENQLRRSRRKEIAHLETSSTQGKQGLSKERGRRNNCREEKKLILENSTSQEEKNVLKRDSEQTVTSLAVSSPSLQGLAEDCKNETQSAKENPSRASRKKTISSKYEQNSSTSLREKPGLPTGRGQKRALKEAEVASLENNSSQEKTRQLKNKRKKVEFTLEAATSPSLCENSDLPEKGDTSETKNRSVTSTGSEKNNQSGEGKEGTPVRQAASTSRKRKCQLPADDFTSKKLKSGSDENGLLPKGKRNKTKEELGEEDVRAAGGTDRKTRSSARTRN